MQSHQVIDILPDRSAETAAAWIATHPEIELVSRDRGGDYASAVKTSAPQAVQCADRFHVLKNLGEALEGLLARHLAARRRGQAEKSFAPPLSEVQAKQPPRRHRKAAELSQAKREERLAKYEQVVALRKQGFSQTAIASQVGIGHMTVSRWLAHGMFPEYQSPLRKTGVDIHLPYLRERWEAGYHNMAQLYRELLERGYTQSYQSMHDQLR
jgi:transposase